MKRSYFSYALVLAVVLLVSTNSFAQDKYKDKIKSKLKQKVYSFCSGSNWSNGDRVSSKDLRETTLSAGDVKVNSRNGRITVIGSDRSDVLVRACVRAWGYSATEAKEAVDSIRIETSGEITADTPRDSNSSISYEIHVPRSTNLDLYAQNGRITISSVDGQIRFKTSNGRVTLSDLAGDVQGETSNGRVTVKLNGNAWNGNGLNVKTRNGRVTVYMPSSYAADFELRTNNGRFSSDVNELQTQNYDERGRKRRGGSHRVKSSVNGGGAPIKVTTGNGRVTINSN